MSNRSLEIKNGIATTSSSHLNAKFEVLNDSERNLLITKKQIKKGHIIFHVNDNTHYYLKEYPVEGNITGVVWETLGLKGSNSLTSNSEDTVLTSKGAKELKDLVTGTSYITTYYIKSGGSQNPTSNSLNSPFSTLESALLSLENNSSISADQKVRIYFLGGGTFAGCSLPFRDIVWEANVPCNIDFTNINTGGRTNYTGRAGRIIQTQTSDALKTRVFTFLGGNISLISDNDFQYHSFSVYEGKLKIEGHIDTISFHCDSGGSSSTSTIDATVFKSDVESNLIIEEYVNYSDLSFFFAKNSIITIKKLTLETNMKTPDQESIITLDVISLNGKECLFRDFKILNLTTIDGTGASSGSLIIYGSNKDNLLVNFINTEVIFNCNITFMGGTITGSCQDGIPSISTELGVSDRSATMRIKDFSGPIEQLIIERQLILEGTNYITVPSGELFILKEPSSGLGSDGKVVIIKSGVTTITAEAFDETSDGLFHKYFTFNNTKVIIKGDLYSNTSIYGDAERVIENMEGKGVNIQNSLGDDKWSSKDIKFNGMIFDEVNQIIKPDIAQILNDLPISINGFNIDSGEWYYNTTDETIKKK